MHKSLFNEAIIKLIITPAGPILIKAGEGLADPTKPDMNFVRTMHHGQEKVYLPGSSLKGVLRSHCERLARTVQGKQHLSCNPLHPKESCSEQLNDKSLSAPLIHQKSCFVCRMFGHTSLASHFRISDAFPMGDYRTEERNGVAIDRVFGSVAVGPFNYETVTSGEFQTTLYLKNFSLAQLGLLSLALRDLTAARVRLGFGKSRGLGAVTARVNELTLRYPSCALNEGKVQMPNGYDITDSLVGAGKFIEQLVGNGQAAAYGYQANDEVALEKIAGYGYEPSEWDEPEIRAPRRPGLRECATLKGKAACSASTRIPRT